MGEFTPIILIALVGFFVLAAILLIPVYRFLKREEQAGKRWNEEIERRNREHLETNGSESMSG